MSIGLKTTRQRQKGGDRTDSTPRTATDVRSLEERAGRPPFALCPHHTCTLSASTTAPTHYGTKCSWLASDFFFVSKKGLRALDRQIRQITIQTRQITIQIRYITISRSDTSRSRSDTSRSRSDTSRSRSDTSRYLDQIHHDLDQIYHDLDQIDQIGHDLDQIHYDIQIRYITIQIRYITIQIRQIRWATIWIRQITTQIMYQVDQNLPLQDVQAIVQDRSNSGNMCYQQINAKIYTAPVRQHKLDPTNQAYICPPRQISIMTCSGNRSSVPCAEVLHYTTLQYTTPVQQ